MSYTPVELRHVRVARSLLGYNRGMVEQMIEEVAESFEATWREREELADRVEALEKQIVELRKREELLTNTLVAAEQAATNVREQARLSAEKILGEAQQQARALLRAAEARRETLGLESRRIEGMLRAALVMVEEGNDLSGLARSQAAAQQAEPGPNAAEPEPRLGSAEPSVERQPVSLERESASAAPSPAAERWQKPQPPPAAAPAPAELEPHVAPLEEAAAPFFESDPEGWPLEETGEFKPVELPPLADEPEPEESLDATPFLRRLAGRRSRDFDWGD